VCRLYEYNLIDLIGPMHCSQSHCFRIGNRRTLKVGSISVGNKVVHWLNEVLGVTILSATKFTQNSKRTQQNKFVYVDY